MPSRIAYRVSSATLAHALLRRGLLRKRGGVRRVHLSYYEDNHWLDITEWFDCNNYNPIDESWWRWDDEPYSTP
ncbi:MAG TPA: hypothetical protein VGN72_11180 [Tepidisphaeraceae bacterium]|jgi:hypothetical protein|nr:hypothetical protein [Tepidisphaeraceae bacterium]